MAKEDFCFTYYDGDAARDTTHMNRLERGAYHDIIISQRKFGHLTLEQIKKILGKDFSDCWPAIELILKVDTDGKFFVEWLENSVIKARKHARKQSDNRKGKTKQEPELTKQQPNNNQTKPLGDENGDGIEDEDVSGNELNGKFENFFHGEVPADLVDLADALWGEAKHAPFPKAGPFQNHVQERIEKLGYTVKREQTCEYISKEGKRINGRIDLVASHGDVLIGIELDDRQPRLKSIRKVETYTAGIVILRDPKPKAYSIPVELPSKTLVSSDTFSDAEYWTEQVISNNDENFNVLLKNRGINPGEQLIELARDHLDMANRYQWHKKWDDQKSFRYSLLKHIVDNISKLTPKDKKIQDRKSQIDRI